MLHNSINLWLQNFEEQEQWFSPMQGIIVLLKKQPLCTNEKPLQWQIQICIIDVDDCFQNKGIATTFIKSCLLFIEKSLDERNFLNSNTTAHYVSLQVNQCQTERFYNFLLRLGGVLVWKPNEKHPSVLFEQPISILQSNEFSAKQIA